MPLGAPDNDFPDNDRSTDQEYEAAEPTTAEPGSTDTDSTPTVRVCMRRAVTSPTPLVLQLRTHVTDDEVLQRRERAIPARKARYTKQQEQQQ